jgi:hypothetical protein
MMRSLSLGSRTGTMEALCLINHCERVFSVGLLHIVNASERYVKSGDGLLRWRNEGAVV